MASEITLHVELSGQDRDLLERVCENLEWYREQARLMQVEQEARAMRKDEAREQVL